jgi:hypothetical protein
MQFIVETKPGVYFVRFTRDRIPTILTIGVMSAAAHFDDYAAADRLCQFLRNEGYDQAVVCDIAGQLVTANILDARPQQIDYPKTKTEYKTLIGAMPQKLIRQRRRSDLVFDAALRKFEDNPTTLESWEEDAFSILAAIAAGDTPAQIAKKLGVSTAELLQQLTIARKKLESFANAAQQSL